jgi:ABC-type dipeptide/oligopeptide/nickel transport system permease subunit
MSFFANVLTRVLGPAAVLAIAAALLAPSMSQPSSRMLHVDVVRFAADRLWTTSGVIAPAFMLATLIWLPLAVLTARRGYHAGLTVAPVSVLAQGLAPFCAALLGLLLFSTPARLLPAAGATSAVHVILPAGALAVVLLGFLAHKTYLRAISTQALAAEVDGVTSDSRLLWPEIAEDWFETLGRHAGLLVGALVLIEAVFRWPGLGRLFVDGLSNADTAVRSAALFDLIALSAALVAAFGIGAELVRRQLERRRALTPAVLADGPSRMPHVEPRWLTVLTVALGGLMLVVLMLLATSTVGEPFAARPDAALLAPGTSGYTFGTDSLGRDVHARVAAGISESVGQAFWLLFTAVLAIPVGLLAARMGRLVEGTLGVLLDGLLSVSPLLLVMAWMVHEPRGAGHQVLVGYVMGPVLVLFIRDAVRAVWPGERRDVSAVVGAILMAALVGMSYAILLDASLGFLGIGMPRMETVHLGEMMQLGGIVLARAPWLTIYPGVVLTALASSLILIGYGALGLLRSRPRAVAAHAEASHRLAEA